MRKLVTISMPWEMHERLVRRVTKTRYATVSEYIRELIRRDEDKARKALAARSTSAGAAAERNDPPFVIVKANDLLSEYAAEQRKERAR